MRRPFILLFLIPYMLYASNITTNIETKAAMLSSCNTDIPCMVSVRESEDQYIVNVTKSVLITEYGVLKFLPGGVTIYIFDEKGELVRTHKTP